MKLIRDDFFFQSVKVRMAEHKELLQRADSVNPNTRLLELLKQVGILQVIKTLLL